MKQLVFSLLTVVLVSCASPLGERSAAVVSGSCMDDVWKSHGNTQSLGCTANDVGIASASNIRGLDGQPLEQCIAGTTFSFIADFTVHLTAQERYDVGLYFATDGDPNHDGALTGSCSVNVITPLADGLGSVNFVELDQALDACGDIDGGHNPQIVTVRVDNVLCQDSDSDSRLNLPNCTSWRQSGSNELCQGVNDAYPGSPSKCNCDIGFNVPLVVAPPEASIVKSFVGVRCWTGIYRATISNDSLTQVEQLLELVDSTFGDLMTVHDRVVATTCASTALPVGGSYTCEFDATTCGPTETDTITATLLGEDGTVITRTSNTLVVNVTATASSL